MNVRGWNDIAYNLVACDHDYLFEGRHGGTAANGTDYGNEHFPAVCWLGGPGHTPKDGALRAIDSARGRLGGNDKPIYPHNHFYATACPGPFLTAWVKGGAHPPGAPPAPKPVLHWGVTFTDDQGQQQTRGPWTGAQVDDFRLRVSQNHVDDKPGDPNTVYIATFYPGGAPA